MCKKIFIVFLLLSLINLFVGCATSKAVPVAELNSKTVENEHPDYITLIPRDAYSKVYHFSYADFYTDNDTLYGRITAEELYFDGKFVSSQILSIHLKDTRSLVTIPLTFEQMKEIDKEKSRSYEILVTTNNAIKYRFMKPDYYIESDTIYAKGKMAIYGIKIAHSDILSIQFENTNLGSSLLLGFGVTLGAVLGAIGLLAILFYIAMSGMKK